MPDATTKPQTPADIRARGHSLIVRCGLAVILRLANGTTEVEQAVHELDALTDLCALWQRLAIWDSPAGAEPAVAAAGPGDPSLPIADGMTGTDPATLGAAAERLASAKAAADALLTPSDGSPGSLL